MGLTDHPVVIVGMQRSGTSSVTQALAALGVFFGDESEFYAPDANNEAGYYEIGEVIRTNKDLLYAFHRPWNLVRPFPENWHDLPQGKDSLTRLRDLLEKHFSDKGRWGFKEPTTALLLPVYNRLFKEIGIEPTYVICVRNPLDVLLSVNKHAASYVEAQLEAHEVDPRRAGQSFNPAPLGNLALGMWMHATLFSLREASGARSTVVLYEDYLQNSRPFLESIVKALDGWTPSADDWAAAEATVRTSLRHNSHPLQELDRYPSLLKRTYEVSVKASRNVVAFRNGELNDEINALWDELVLSRDMLREPDPLLGNLTLSWLASEGVKAIEKVFHPKPGWQKLTCAFDAPRGGLIIGAFYHQPCVVWIRKAVWRAGPVEVPLALEPGPSCEISKTEDGLTRLFANSEVFQFRGQVPDLPGPFELEFELWLEIDEQVVIDGISQLVANLQGVRERLAAAENRLRQIQQQGAAFSKPPNRL